MLSLHENSATRTADSGLVAATKEEGVTHVGQYALLAGVDQRRVRTLVTVAGRVAEGAERFSGREPDSRCP